MNQADGGLTAEQLIVACKNIGYDLTCGECACLFYTGHRGNYPHSETCKTDVLHKGVPKGWIQKKPYELSTFQKVEDECRTPTGVSAHGSYVESTNGVMCCMFCKKPI